MELLKGAPKLGTDLAKQYWLEDHVPQSKMLGTIITVYDELSELKNAKSGDPSKELERYLSSIARILYYSLDGDSIRVAENYARGRGRRGNGELVLSPQSPGSSPRTAE